MDVVSHHQRRASSSTAIDALFSSQRDDSATKKKKGKKRHTMSFPRLASKHLKRNEIQTNRKLITMQDDHVHLVSMRKHHQRQQCQQYIPTSAETKLARKPLGDLLSKALDNPSFSSPLSVPCLPLFVFPILILIVVLLRPNPDLPFWQHPTVVPLLLGHAEVYNTAASY